ncbi:MAG: methylenetetrahydrofolate reductase C-terminal domain-containing protein [Planctomycetota bacterium]|jgi:hypothetical protein
MLYTENKPIEEVLESIGDEKKIFVLACNGCVEACETGGELGQKAMEAELAKAGKTVTGSVLVDFLCNKLLIGSRLSVYKEKVRECDSVLVLSCGIGVQAAAKVTGKVVHAGLNTVSLGGLQGLWPSEERCQACGTCYLDLTGGLCPITTCAKSMLNGPCGGADQGKCEVDPDSKDNLLRSGKII